MKTSTALALAGAVGAGLYFLTRNASAAPPAAPLQSNPGFSISPQVSDPGPVVPQLGPAYAALKPIATYVTTPLVHAINGAVGGVTPYGKVTGIKPNADGTFTGTDGTGASVTFHKDGTITRHNPSFSQTNGGKVIIATGKGVAAAAKGVAHAAESVVHGIVSIL